MIHGCIDGFSRVTIYLAARHNNKASTILELFKGGVEEYGLPSRVRCDMGGENLDVCKYMEEKRGENRGSAIRGKSVHNQRVERLWVDVWKGVTNVYYDLFSYMESEKLLEMENPVHLWALHYIFLPRINSDLSLFQDQWNNHGLRSEGHMSPNQLFVSRALELFGSERTAVKDLFDPAVEPEVHEQYGVEDVEDLDQEGTQEDSEEAHVVPCPLNDENLGELKRQIDPFSGDELGINCFQQVLQFIHDCS